MDATRFDALARTLASSTTRRNAGRLLTGLGLAGLLAHVGGIAIVAKQSKKNKKGKKGKKGKKRRKNNKRNKGKTGIPKQQAQFNEFGCVNAGDFCENAGQCCSGICANTTCRAHDTGSGACDDGGLGFCAAPGGGLVAAATCTTSADTDGFCKTTTGNAPYCAGSEPFTDCAPSVVPCTKDTDCQAACGPQAACVQCPACAEVVPGLTTACAGPDAESCVF